jgi:hypothetical protein
VLYELSAGVAAARSQQRSTALRPFEDFIRGEDAAIVIDYDDNVFTKDFTLKCGCCHKTGEHVAALACAEMTEEDLEAMVTEIDDAM